MPVVLQNRFGFLLDCGLLEGFFCSPQANVMAGKVPEVGVLGTAEKKVKILEQQRMEVGGWTRGMKAPLGSLVPTGPRSF